MKIVLKDRRVRHNKIIDTIVRQGNMTANSGKVWPEPPQEKKEEKPSQE